MQWSNIIRTSLLVFLEFSATSVFAKNMKGIPCVSLSGADGTCRQLKYCWISFTNPQPQFNYCPGKFAGNLLVCCPDDQPLRPIEQKCLDYSHVIHRKLPTTTSSPTSIISYNSTSSSSEDSVEDLPKKLRIYPHLVKIALGPRDQMRFKCTGTIITHRFVLTSAVCTSSPTGKARHVWLGDIPYYRSSEENQNRFLYAVQDRIVYKNYNQSNLFHDVGLLKLKRDILFDFYTRPACINVDHAFDRKDVVATEWEHQQKDIQILDHESCNKHFVVREILDSEQFCVKLRNNCKFTTGSPLQVPHPEMEGMALVVGLLTFRKDCLRGESIVAYTRISQFSSWIEDMAFK